MEYGLLSLLEVEIYPCGMYARNILRLTLWRWNVMSSTSTTMSLGNPVVQNLQNRVVRKTNLEENGFVRTKKLKGE